MTAPSVPVVSEAISEEQLRELRADLVCIAKTYPDPYGDVLKVIDELLSRRAADAQIERMRAIVNAALLWNQMTESEEQDDSDQDDAEWKLKDAVKAYLEARRLRTDAATNPNDIAELPGT